MDVSRALEYLISSVTLLFAQKSIQVNNDEIIESSELLGLSCIHW